MTLLYRIGLIALIIIAAFFSGFSFGRYQERNAILKSTVEAFQTREVIDHEVSNLSPVDACIAIGGLPDECATLLQRLEETAQSE